MIATVKRGEPRQLFGKLPEEIMGQSDLSDGAKVIFAALMMFALGQRHCWPSQDRLAKATGRKERAVRNALQDLKKAGYITVERHQRQTATYVLHLDGLDLVVGPQDLDRHETTGQSERPDLNRHEKAFLTGRKSATDAFIIEEIKKEENTPLPTTPARLRARDDADDEESKATIGGSGHSEESDPGQSDPYLDRIRAAWEDLIIGEDAELLGFDPHWPYPESVFRAFREEYGEELPVAALDRFRETKGRLSSLDRPRSYGSYLKTLCRNADEWQRPISHRPATRFSPHRHDLDFSPSLSRPAPDILPPPPATLPETPTELQPILEVIQTDPRFEGEAALTGEGDSLTLWISNFFIADWLGRNRKAQAHLVAAAGRPVRVKPSTSQKASGLCLKHQIQA